MAPNINNNGAVPLRRNPKRATTEAEVPPSGPWTSVNYFNVMSNAVSDQPQPQPSSAAPPDDNVDDPLRPAKRLRLDATRIANKGDDYIVLSRLTIVDKKALGDDEEPPALRQPLQQHPINTFFRIRLNNESGLDLIAGDGLKSRVKVPAKQPFCVRPLSDEEKYLVEVHKKTVHHADSVLQVHLSASSEYTSSSKTVTLSLHFELRWIIHPQLRDLYIWERNLRDSVIARYFPDVSLTQKRGPGNDNSDVNTQADWSPQSFYEAAHVTSKEDDDSDDLHVHGLTATLFPFQHRAVKWLLKREGVSWSSRSAPLVPYTQPADPALTSHFVAKKDVDGSSFYISGLLGAVTRDLYSFQQANDDACRGGILSEEMGLGKTVEMISLILLHRPPPIEKRDVSHMENPKFGGTLILTPSALKTQWIDEIKRHAPYLRVMVYNGMTKSRIPGQTEAAIVEQFCKHDVVIATYTDLRSEIHFATDAPDRNLRQREEPSDLPRSPLIQLSWWRVCLDEAQEIESGVSNVAALAQRIPRTNSWGVSGTPVKDNVNDLWALLMFIQYEPYGSKQDLWKKLVRDDMALFKTVFSRVAMRHTKRLVRDELTIPPQKRYVIKMSHTAVEEQNYESLFESLVHACRLETDGTPLSDSWDPEDPGTLSTMQTTLNRLRMVCLHPDLDKSLKFRLPVPGNKAAPIRTVDEVLDTMIEQSEGALAIEHRALLSHKLKRGQLLENSPRAKEALAVWQEALEECRQVVKDARDRVQLETQRASEANKAQAQDASKGKDKDSDDDSDDDQDNAAGGKLAEAQRELRYSLEVLHKAEFFCANGYFQVKSNVEWTPPDSDAFKELERLETESYERAKLIRREILSESLAKAMRAMEDIQGKAASQGFVEIPESQFPQPTGIETRRTGEDLDRLSYVLSKQAAQMDAWREALVQLLLKDLVDNDDVKDEAGKTVEITGDEYEDSTKVQDEIQVYLTILKAGVSDRKFLITGVTPSILASNEEAQAQLSAKNGEGPAPELTLRVFEERRVSLLPPDDDEVTGAEVSVAATPPVGSLRSCIVDMRDLSSRLHDQQAVLGSGRGHTVASQRISTEISCVTKQMRSAQREQTRQLKVIADLEKELNKVRTSLNARIAYYRQLQTVSDMVALYKGPKDDEAIAAIAREEEQLAQKYTVAESKHRYLQHLKEMDSSEESRTCIICQSSFTVGVLTVCGHQFCKECMSTWFAAHRNCPLCKRKLNIGQLHDIVYKPRELKVVDDHGGDTKQLRTGQSSNGGGGSSSSSNNENDNATHGPQIYEAFGKDKVAEIMNIDLPGQSFTTKIDTLVRHILWLRTSDPGAKAIVFSQYTPFLSILAAALKHHGISFTSYTKRNGIDKFRSDPNIECFLLHARAHASGLNLVVASHVLLCEPLLNTAIELQAIARVHRIGQLHTTTVWLFIIEGTVEESVHALSVKRRLAHIGGGRGNALKNDGNDGNDEDVEMLDDAPDMPDLDDRLEVANSLRLEQTLAKNLFGKGRAMGEEVDKNDVWLCLFGNRQKREDAASSENMLNQPGFRRLVTANAADERAQEMRD